MGPLFELHPSDGLTWIWRRGSAFQGRRVRVLLVHQRSQRRQGPVREDLLLIGEPLQEQVALEAVFLHLGICIGALQWKPDIKSPLIKFIRLQRHYVQVQTCFSLHSDWKVRTTWSRFVSTYGLFLNKTDHRVGQSLLGRISFDIALYLARRLRRGTF